MGPLYIASKLSSLGERCSVSLIGFTTYSRDETWFVGRSLTCPCWEMLDFSWRVFIHHEKLTEQSEFFPLIYSADCKKQLLKREGEAPGWQMGSNNPREGWGEFDSTQLLEGPFFLPCSAAPCWDKNRKKWRLKIFMYTNRSELKYILLFYSTRVEVSKNKIILDRFIWVIFGR